MKICKAIVIVGLLGLSVGIVLAGDAANDNREVLVRSLRMMGFRAQEYYHTLNYQGGGQGSFTGLTLSGLTSRPTNANGSYALSGVTATQITLTGTGVETGNDGSTPVQVQAIVYPDSLTVTPLN